jgi:hypothetical protein
MCQRPPIHLGITTHLVDLDDSRQTDDAARESDAQSIASESLGGAIRVFFN